jgi:hypothetical protein
MKKTLLGAVSAVALTAIGLPANATDVVIDITSINLADQLAVFAAFGGIGVGINSTVAAIGNSLTFNDNDGSANIEASFVQVNVAGPGQAAINFVGFEGLGSQGVQLNSVAVGNLISGQPLLPDGKTPATTGGTLDASDLVQINVFQAGQLAVAALFDTTTTGGDNAVAATAVGNAIGLTVGAFIDQGGPSAIVQINKDLAGQAAFANVDGVAVPPPDLTTLTPTLVGNLSVSATAIGNSLSLTTLGSNYQEVTGDANSTGNLEVDKLVQVNAENLGQLADTDISNVELNTPEYVTITGKGTGSNPFVTTTTPAGAPGNLVASAVAVGNVGVLVAANDLDFVDIDQINAPLFGQTATVALNEVQGVGTASLTAVAIGNSLSLTADNAGPGTGFFNGAGVAGDIFQGNFGGPQFAGTFIFDSSIVGTDTITTAAIGNALSLTGDVNSSTTPSGAITATQLNFTPQTALTIAGFSNVGTLTATTAALGNTVSITIK